MRSVRKDDRICINKSANDRIIETGFQIVACCFFIIDIPAIPEGIEQSQRIGHRPCAAHDSPPSIVLVFYHLAAICVNQRDDIALQVVQVGVGSTIEQNHRRLILCIVEKVQTVAAARHMYNVLTVKRVLSGASGGSHLLHPQAILIVGEADRTGGVGIGGLTQDVAAQIIGIHPSRAIAACRGVIGIVGSDQLAQQIVGIADRLDAIADAGDVARIVIGIGQRRAEQGNGLYQRRSAARAMAASQIAVSRGNAGAARIDSTTGDTAQTVIDISGEKGGASEEAPPKQEK